MAEATGWAKLNLLEGEANVYFENTFVGKSILSPREAGDTLRFSMGRDRSIRIERTKENDYLVAPRHRFEPDSERGRGSSPSATHARSP
ncbi:MAG: hypothetical protein ACLVK4_15860 [Alistipes shahii]|uniref:hypothetical protein n=1 Tax=Alistipes shahii TaxID=328814 RepID=UPI00399D1057